MIKNAALGGLAMALALAGCPRAAPTPPGYQGVVEYDERVLSFEVAGRVQEVRVKRGDVVKPGDLLATVDDTVERLMREARSEDARAAAADVALLQAGARPQDVASLAAQVAAAKASEGLLGKSAERVRALAKMGAATAADLDRAEAELQRATAERRSLEERLAALREGARREELSRARARSRAATSSVALESERLARASLKALVGGTVVDVHVDPGELAAVGTPAVTVADTGHPYIDVFVPEGDVGGIRVGAAATVRVDSVKQQMAGTVEHVARKAEFTPRFLFSPRERPNLVMRVRVRVDDAAEKLHAGVPAFVEIAR